MRDLSERADFDGLHELGEDVAAGGGDLLQALEGGGRFVGVALLERTHRGDLILLFFFGGAKERRALVFLCGSTVWFLPRH